MKSRFGEGLFWGGLILFVGVRFVGVGKLVPESWTKEKQVKVRLRVMDEIYQNGSKYILNQGRWVMVWENWPGFKVGECGEFVGEVRLDEKWNKQVKGLMYDPVIKKSEVCGEMSLWERVRVGLVRLRGKWMKVLRESLPEPHASLAGGILLGVRSGMPEGFYEDLVQTGTLHVVAASGYNVSIVMRVLLGVGLMIFSRGVGLMVGFLGVVGYVVVAGGSAAVVRAGVMGVLSSSSYFWGRTVEVKRMLWLVSLLMLIFEPLLVFDAGFQLSVAATAGILYLERGLRRRLEGKWEVLRREKVKGYLSDTLYPTLAASVFTLPIIFWWFGRVSWVSPIANMLVLSLVPMVMGLSFLVVLGGWWWGFLGRVLAVLLYVPLEVFVRLVEWLG